MHEPVLAAWRPCANNQQFRQSPQNTREVFGIHVKFHTESSALWSKVRTHQMHHRKTDHEFFIYVCGNIDGIRRYTQTFYADVYREHSRLYAGTRAPTRRTLGWAGKRQRTPTHPSRSRRQPHRPAPTYTPPPVSARARTCAPRSNSWPCRPRVDAPGHASGQGLQNAGLACV